MAKVSREVARQHEIDAWRLRCEGYDQYVIADKLGISQSGVSKLLKRVCARKAGELAADVEERRQVHTARLERIYREAMTAWDESKKPKQKSRSQKTVMPIPAAQLEQMEDGKALLPGTAAGGAIPLKEITTKEASKSDGDPAYLATALHADAELRKLHGINAPKQLDILDKRRPYEKASDEELRARAREADELLAAEGARE